MSTHLLGLDIGSSSIKAALVDADSGRVIAAAQSPATEMKILASRVAWAEQDPEQWWQHVCHAAAELRTKQPAAWQNVAAIGISYQMHGLVLTDSDQRPVRPSIIWCDSRAVEIGDQAFADLGRDYCLSHLLNSPGNFTASKLAWVKRNEPDVLSRAQYMMLPGDYIALKLTGEASTTAAGLSEGMLWDFKSNQTAQAVLEHYELNSDLIPPLVPIVGEQGVLCSAAAKELELSDGVMVSYRAGDQPNNAMSLACLKPGEVAATAGTSGVVYAVSDQLVADAESRVNTFMHVNGDTASRTGVLLCINGAGALYRWVRELLDETSYDALNALARDIDPGACGLLFSPYGNGAERSLSNASPGAGLSGLQVNTHGKGHFVRSALEGICFAFKLGVDLLQELEVPTSVVRAGRSNMFQSELFSEVFASVVDSEVVLYETDGAAGAARAAGVGIGTYQTLEEALSTLQAVQTISPHREWQEQYCEIYQEWRSRLR